MAKHNHIVAGWQQLTLNASASLHRHEGVAASRFFPFRRLFCFFKRLFSETPIMWRLLAWKLCVYNFGIFLSHGVGVEICILYCIFLLGRAG